VTEENPPGRRLRQSHHEHGLSQEKLADQAGISLATVARLVRQARPPRRFWRLGRRASARRALCRLAGDNARKES
jgi:hypothetical protein